MNKPPPQDNTFFIPLTDITLLLKKHKLIITAGIIIFAMLLGGFSLLRKVQYLGEATFKEKSNSSAAMNSSSLASVILNGLDSEGKSEAKTMMSSKKLLKRVVKSLDLQALLENASELNVLQNPIQNLKIEANYLTGLKKYSLPKIDSSLSVNNVQFSGEFPISLKVVFDEKNNYEVFDDKKNKIGSGVLGAPFITKDYHFTIDKNTHHKIDNKHYLLTLNPLSESIKDLSKNIEIKTDKEDPSLLKLTYLNRNPQIASSVLNQLMLIYQNYLENEQTRVAQEQIKYLNRREEQMEKKLHAALGDYAAKMSSDVSAFGYADTRLAMDFLTSQLQQFQRKKLLIDLELQKLGNALSEKPEALMDAYLSSDSPKFLSRIIEEIGQLKQESDTIKFSIPKMPPKEISQNLKEQDEFQGINLASSDKLYVAYQKQLSDIENQILQCNFLIHQLQDPEFEISSLSSIITDPGTRELVSHATTLVLTLQDDSNRSLKEKERMKNELGIQRRFLNVHLHQTVDLLNLNQKLIKDKIQTLQYAKLQLIEQQISILEKQLADGIKTHIENLKEERKFLNEYESALKIEMASLPHKWASEKILEQQLTMNSKMNEEIAKLIESKNIAANLEMVQSAPIDFASPPLHPLRPHCILFMTIGALLGALISATSVIIKYSAANQSYHRSYNPQFEGETI